MAVGHLQHAVPIDDLNTTPHSQHPLSRDIRRGHSKQIGCRWRSPELQRYRYFPASSAVLTYSSTRSACHLQLASTRCCKSHGTNGHELPLVYDFMSSPCAGQCMLMTDAAMHDHRQRVVWGAFSALRRPFALLRTSIQPPLHIARTAEAQCLTTTWSRSP